MPIKIAINGFGRIGRQVFKILMGHPGFEVAAINDLTDSDTLAHLLKYDSVHGKYPGTVTTDNGHLIVDDQSIPILAERDPTRLP